MLLDMYINKKQSKNQMQKLLDYILQLFRR